MSYNESTVLKGEAIDHSFLEETFRTHYAYFLRAARKITRSDTDAHDLIHDAFINASNGLENFKGAQYIKTWVVRIMINLHKDRSRKTVRQEFAHHFFRHKIHDGSGLSESPERKLERDEVHEKVHRALTTMSPFFRNVLVAIDIEEKSYGQTSIELRKPIGTIKSGLSRARKQLRVALNGY